MKNMHFTKKDWVYIAMIILSAFIYSCGMNSFVKSGNLFPGGYAGISRLVSGLCSDYLNIPLSFSVIYFVLNALTCVFVWKRIGHKFLLYSFLWFTLTSVFTSVLKLPEVTSDPLLISVFGGLINGFAIGISLRNNASSGGMDFIAIDISSHLKKPAWNYIFAVNVVVLVIAGCVYGWDRALYSIIFQYASKEIVNMMHQKYQMTRIEIVTDRPDEVCSAVFSEVRHGITKVECTGAYHNQEHSLLLITVGNDQVKDVVRTITTADPKAFIIETTVRKLVGNFYQKPIE